MPSLLSSTSRVSLLANALAALALLVPPRIGGRVIANDLPLPLTESEFVRLMTKVKITRGCWLWMAADNGLGYGKIYIRGRLYLAHRLLYAILRGPIKETMDHLCRNPRCVNPWHLEDVSMLENCLRGESIWAQNARKTHCVNGHPFTEENTYLWTDGTRKCRLCNKLRKREEHARKYAAGLYKSQAGWVPRPA